jgi:hypothetical protein
MKQIFVLGRGAQKSRVWEVKYAPPAFPKV